MKPFVKPAVWSNHKRVSGSHANAEEGTTPQRTTPRERQIPKGRSDYGASSERWRFEMIPYKTHTLGFRPLPVIGILVWAGLWGFMGYLILGSFHSRKHLPFEIVVLLTLAGPMCHFFAAMVDKMLERGGWVDIKAKCIDRQFGVISTHDGDGRPAWGWRWLVKFEWEGKSYTVTPHDGRAGRGDNWIAEVEADGEKRLDANGDIMIRINPNNPKQAIVLH